MLEILEGQAPQAPHGYAHGCWTSGFDPDSPDLEQFVLSLGMEQFYQGLENFDFL